MDYGFAPGGTKFDKIVRDYLRFRPASTMLQPAAGTVASFISELGTSTAVTRPVGTLSIGCHGHPYGLLEIPLDATSTTRTSFADVQRVATSGAMEIPAPVLHPRPIIGGGGGGFPQPAVFRIVGCSIGAALPFLRQLKKALGVSVVVVATPHEDAEVKLNINGKDGVLRMLVYDFRLSDPIALEGPADIVEAFHNKHLTFFDGAPVPREFWKARVPNEIYNGKGRKAETANIRFKPAIDGVTTLPLAMEWWEWKWESVGPFPVTPPATNLASTDQRRSFMRDAIRSRAEFAAGHLFPLHAQRGYASYDAFIDGHDWLNAPGETKLWMGYRNLYRVGSPIDDPPSSGNLLYDWADSTSTHTRLGLDETDARLFTIIV